MADSRISWTDEPEDKTAFTQQYDQGYTRFAKLYDMAVKHLPVWKRWISRALPYLEGPRVLETSFGTGYLLGQYAHQFDVIGLDYNQTMVEIARQNLERLGKSAVLVRGDVGRLPFQDEYFDTVLCTMAFSGYPDGNQALEQLRRVLKPDGRLVIVDINYPVDRNWIGCAFTRMWEKGGDIIRDMDDLFTRHNFDYTKETIGGFGSVQLFVAVKAGPPS
jgi:ubiquinone/menaquinone biosynthesis C-methylase UbiE